LGHAATRLGWQRIDETGRSAAADHAAEAARSATLRGPIRRWYDRISGARTGAETLLAATVVSDLIHPATLEVIRRDTIGQ